MELQAKKNDPGHSRASKAASNSRKRRWRASNFGFLLRISSRAL